MSAVPRCWIVTISRAISADLLVLALQEEVGVPRDGREHVVEVVRDPARHEPHRLEPLGVLQLQLERPPLGGLADRPQPRRLRLRERLAVASHGGVGEDRADADREADDDEPLELVAREQLPRRPEHDGRGSRPQPGQRAHHERRALAQEQPGHRDEDREDQPRPTEDAVGREARERLAEPDHQRERTRAQRVAEGQGKGGREAEGREGLPGIDAAEDEIDADQGAVAERPQAHAQPHVERRHPTPGRRAGRRDFTRRVARGEHQRAVYAPHGVRLVLSAGDARRRARPSDSGSQPSVAGQTSACRVADPRAREERYPDT
ncbi:MAG: hypothetical protein QM704_11070 [Anaeromyxobacteraceae bacterium]